MPEVCSVTADRYSHVQNELIDMVGQRNTYRMRARNAELILDRVRTYLSMTDNLDPVVLNDIIEP